MTTTSRPPCSYEREYGPGYTCAHKHCPVCAAHHVARGDLPDCYECQLPGNTCENGLAIPTPEHQTRLEVFL